MTTTVFLGVETSKGLFEDLFPTLIDDLLFFLYLDQTRPELLHGLFDLVVVIIGKHEDLGSYLQKITPKLLIKHYDA